MSDFMNRPIDYGSKNISSTLHNISSRIDYILGSNYDDYDNNDIRVRSINYNYSGSPLHQYDKSHCSIRGKSNRKYKIKLSQRSRRHCSLPYISNKYNTESEAYNSKIEF